MPRQFNTSFKLLKLYIKMCNIQDIYYELLKELVNEKDEKAEVFVEAIKYLKKSISKLDEII